MTKLGVGAEGSGREQDPDKPALDAIAEADRNPTISVFRGLAFEHVVLNMGFIAVVCASVGGVLSRYVTEEPATWVQEVTTISFAWVVFVGAAEVHRAGRHVSVNLLTSFLPVSVQTVLSIAGGVFVALYCFVAAWFGLEQTIASNSASTPILGIPLSVSYAGLTIGFLLMGLRGLQRLWGQVRQIKS